MKRRLSTIYALTCTTLLVAGLVLVFFFAWRAGTSQTVCVLVGAAVSFLVVPAMHEIGHLVFGKAANMEAVYVKVFCLQVLKKKGRKRLSFTSPFSSDQTQMTPKKGGNMRLRASWYVLGGLLFSFLLVTLMLLLGLLGGNFVAWGTLPYAAYLLILNLAPLEYASGKTDTLVFMGLRKGYDAEKCMLSAMEIQGQLYEGKAFSEIDRAYYFDLPQLREDEPLYAILLDLRYRYYLDVEDLESAADCLNRMAQVQAYLSDEEVTRVAAELVYIHSLRGDIAGAEESGKLCREYLEEGSVDAKRILAAYCVALGKLEEAGLLKAQGEGLLDFEHVLGVRKLEEKLLSRIKTE